MIFTYEKSRFVLILNFTAAIFAAAYAYIASEKQGNNKRLEYSMLDFTPSSVGIILKDDSFFPFIKKGSKVPRRKESFSSLRMTIRMRFISVFLKARSLTLNTITLRSYRSI